MPPADGKADPAYGDLTPEEKAVEIESLFTEVAPKPAPADDDRELLATVLLCASAMGQPSWAVEPLVPILRPLIEGKRQAEEELKKERGNAYDLSRDQIIAQRNEAEAELANADERAEDQLHREREAGEILAKSLNYARGYLMKVKHYGMAEGIAEGLAAAEEARRGPKGDDRG